MSESGAGLLREYEPALTLLELEDVHDGVDVERPVEVWEERGLGLRLLVSQLRLEPRWVDNEEGQVRHAAVIRLRDRHNLIGSREVYETLRLE